MSEAGSPYGGSLVLQEPVGSARREMLAEAVQLPTLPLGEPQLSHLEAIATGALSPLTGFMSREDCRSVLRDLRLAGPGGLPWPVPVVLAVPAEWARGKRAGQRVAVTDTAGRVSGIMSLEDLYRPRPEWWSGTGLPGPPVEGVHFAGGPVWLLRRRVPRFPRHQEDPAEVRATLEARGWRSVGAFVAQDVVHRDGEYIMKTCLETLDGLLFHAVVADADDPREFPAKLRVRCYETLLRQYFPPGRVHLAVEGVTEPLGSPRHALLAGIVARNHGCTHIILTPEMAGDDDGSNETAGRLEAAQALYERFGGDVGVRPFFFTQPVHCDACGGMVTDKTCPHGAPDRVMMSRERLRRLLLAGIRPPIQYTRGEIADILCEWARGTL